ncbi:MAG: hypothetical protein KDI30_00280, partial [Pseudomonadales bacterium]|nr:hypothetical protein [Pseudomonadales bacterium]
MLGKLFKPRWQHQNPDIRRQAIEKLDECNEKHQRILAGIALDEKQHDLQGIAIGKLSSIEDLGRVLAATPSITVSQTVAKRINTLLEKKPETEDALVRLISQSEDNRVVAGLIAGSHRPELQQKLMESCQNEDCLLLIANTAPLAKTRQLAAEKIQNTALLEALAKTSKGHDKTLYRIARDRLKSLRDNIRKDEKIQQTLVSLCEKTEGLSRSAFTPLLPNQLQHLKQQWQEAQGSLSELDSRFQQAAEQCQTLIESHAG